MNYINELFFSISIDESLPDSRSLIMPHQSDAVKAMSDYFRTENDLPDRAGLVVMPTGSGKTYTAVTWLLTEGVARGYRIIWLVHRQELVEQTFLEFRKQAPLLKGTGVKKLRILPVSGIHLRASAARRANIYVCSIASVANKYGYRSLPGFVGTNGKERLICVVDEAHHAVSASYQKVIHRLKELNPNMILLGLTATPYRINETELARLHTMFHVNDNLKRKIGTHGYVYEVTLKQLIVSGFLAKPIYERVKTQIVGEIAYECTEEDRIFFSRFGELSERLKNQIAGSSLRNGIILEQYLNGKDRYGKTIVFAVNQLHAETLCKAFKEAGVSCDYAVSNRPDAQEVIQRFKENQFSVLINVQILTEGSDIPDTQTVFLTRQTNSDSLLLQMIGRGLRGLKAGGTKEAFIVSFHDTWNTFAHWLDPGELEIFKQPGDLPTGDPKPEPPKIKPKTEETAEQRIPIVRLDNETGLTLKDLYMRLFESMKASLRSEQDRFIMPVGWYSVVDDDGRDQRVLVFEEQLDSYHDLENSKERVVESVSPRNVLAAYFKEVSPRPEENDIRLLLDYCRESGRFPPYFSLEQREHLDPKEIAEEMQRRYSKEDRQTEWLEKLFRANPVLQDIYHYFYAFKRSVFDAIKQQKEAELVAIDERETYQIVPDQYDLSELLKEVRQMYPKLSTEGLLRISWSRNVVRNWFGFCEKIGSDAYIITINKLLSSPVVDKEVIKYLIFHELLHENGYWNHDKEFRSREWQYPNSAELDGFLDSLVLQYKLDILMRESTASEHHMPDPTEPLEPTYNTNAKGVIEGIKYCRNCGNKLPSVAKYCDRCGAMTEYD